MNNIIFYCESVLTEKADCLGKNIPFGLDHNSFLKHLGSIALFYFNSPLKDDFAAVGDFIYEVYCCTGHLHTVLESLFVNMKPIEALTAE